MGEFYAGLAGCHVYIQSKSPFSYQAKQETSYYFTEDNFLTLNNQQLFPLPAPINGIRLTEILGGFDNFLIDPSGTTLESAAYTTTVQVQSVASSSISGTTTSTGTTASATTSTTVTVQVESDTSAQARLTELGLVNGGESTIPAPQKSFYTWQTCNNFFTIGTATASPTNTNAAGQNTNLVATSAANAAAAGSTPASTTNPAVRNFTAPPQRDNAPEWTYTIQARGDQNNAPLLLTPWMKKVPPDSQSPVHWGVKMTEAMPLDQPFEITYYYCLRDPAIAKDSVPLTPQFNFVNQDGSPMPDLGLTNSVYLAIEFGIGNATDHHLLIFKKDAEPMFFTFSDVNGITSCVYLASFTGFNASQLFDPNHKWFTVKIEAVASSLIISSNVFEKTPWLILASTDGTPILIGQGSVALYGGNVQAGFAMRPVQYTGSTVFVTPPTTFSFSPGASVSGPFSNCSLQSYGDSQQNSTFVANGTAQKVNLADAETITDEGGGADDPEPNGEGITIVQENAQEATVPSGVNRTISIITIPAVDPSNPPDGTDLSFQPQITLTAGNVNANGYIITNGRSPYLWMVRTLIDPGTPSPPTDVMDIAGDVMEINLQWNSSSYQEVDNTGTIKLLNRYKNGVLRLPSNCPTTNYRNMQDKAVYVRIEASWSNGECTNNSNNPQIFNGLIVGWEFTVVAEHEIVTAKVEDFMNALHNGKFVLCPFYDGMKASLAVRDICISAGIPKANILLDGSTLENGADLTNDFGLPFNNPYQEPQFRFPSGSSYKDGILKIAKLDNKTIFFDQLGNFHYDSIPGGIYASASTQPTVAFDTGTSGIPCNWAWNSVTFSRNVNDIYNVFQIIGVDQKLNVPIVAATTYPDGIANPQASGYLGYRKHLMIREAALGNTDAIFAALNTYRQRFFIPPLSVRFDIFGRTDIKPLDIISLDGQSLRILNINTRLNPQENTFWQQIEGEWFYSATSSTNPALFLTSDS